MIFRSTCKHSKFPRKNRVVVSVFNDKGDILNPDSPLFEQRYDLELLELYSGTIVPAIGVTVEF